MKKIMGLFVLTFLLLGLPLLLVSPSLLYAASWGPDYVPGTSNPWLAGMPAGSTASSDSAPAESPVLVGLTITPGTYLTFTASGSETNDPSWAYNGPDGGSFTGHSYGTENGIPSTNAPLDALVGVFLGAGQPNLTPASSGLDFSTIGLNFASLSPGLQQVFFIGDGLTGTGSGTVQQFIVPVGATRLFLGTQDGFGWYNNVGGFYVTATSNAPTPAPEPATMLLLGLGLMGLAGVRRKLKG